MLDVNSMPYCPRCGREVSNEISFCPQCGATLGATTQPATSRIRVTVPFRANIPRSSDLLGVISVGAFLVLVGLTWYRYSIDPSMISNYIQKMTDKKGFIKPPMALLDPMIFFLYAVGVWEIVLSGLRIVLEKRVRKALGDLFGCFFSFFCAFLLTNYAANVFTEQIMGAYFIIAIGLLIIANAIVSLVFPEKK
jgi:hypothetical protein